MIKTFTGSSLEELDNKVNAFMKEKCRNLPVRTESFVVGSLVMHKATVFFEPPMVSKESNNVPEPKKGESAFEEVDIPLEDIDDGLDNPPKPAQNVPNPDKLGALWIQKDDSISGTFKKDKLKIPDKWNVKLNELDGDSKITLKIRGIDCVIFRNKFKNTIKHPDFIIMKKRVKEE